MFDIIFLILIFVGWAAIFVAAEKIIEKVLNVRIQGKGLAIIYLKQWYILYGSFTMLIILYLTGAI